MWLRQLCMSSRQVEPDHILLLKVSSLVVVRGRVSAAYFTCRRRHVPHPPNERERRKFDFSDARGMVGHGGMVEKGRNFEVSSSIKR